VAYSANAVDLVLAGTATPTAPLVIAPPDTSIYTAVGTSAVFGAQAQGAALVDLMGRASLAAAAQPHGWINANASQTNVGGTNGEPGFQANRYGFLAGLDRRLGDGTVGVAVGYDQARPTCCALRCTVRAMSAR
jgi:outer membrane autotransporter protein